MRRGKGLRARSLKTEELYVERRKFVERFLAEHVWCEVIWDNQCRLKAQDVHERLPRSAGGKIVGGEDDQYVATCRYCHDMIGSYPQEAHRRGFRKWSWESENSTDTTSTSCTPGLTMHFGATAPSDSRL
jgi:hypothetical protein